MLPRPSVAPCGAVSGSPQVPRSPGASRLDTAWPRPALSRHVLLLWVLLRGLWRPAGAAVPSGRVRPPGSAACVPLGPGASCRRALCMPTGGTAFGEHRQSAARQGSVWAAGHHPLKGSCTQITKVASFCLETFLCIRSRDFKHLGASFSNIVIIFCLLFLYISVFSFLNI